MDTCFIPKLLILTYESGKIPAFAAFLKVFGMSQPAGLASLPVDAGIHPFDEAVYSRKARIDAAKAGFGSVRDPLKSFTTENNTFHSPFP